MRVIAGKFKGKKLISPQGSRIRPTSDRIKETIFNILSSKKGIEDKAVLDLFSGSGALGIEALSRGAQKVIFSDENLESVRLTKENLKKMGASSDDVYYAEFELALKKLKNAQIDIILADPPYGEKLENKIIFNILKYNVLKIGGILMIEHSTDNFLPLFEDNFICDKRECGNMSLSFYTLIKEAQYE